MQYEVNMDGNLYEMQNDKSRHRGDLLAFLGLCAGIAFIYAVALILQ